MRRSARRAIAALAIASAVAALAAGCGSPRSTADIANTADAGGTAIATPTPSKLDLINQRLAAHGEPTIAPGTDVSQGYPYDKTAEANAQATADAAPKGEAVRLPCGPQTERAGPLATDYGPLSADCAKFGTKLVVTTLGDQASQIPGALGVYQCAQGDTACLSSGEPIQSGQWQIFVSPIGAAVKLLLPERLGHLLVVLPGEYCFDIDKLAWVIPCDWDVTPTPSTTAKATPATPPPAATPTPIGTPEMPTNPG